MNLSVPEYILSIKPYVPGKPIEELEREYGINDSIKLASNENPLGPSPRALTAIQNGLANLHRYPDGSGYMLTRKLAAKLQVKPENIILGNGSDDIISLLAQGFLQAGDEAIMPQPAFLMYDIVVRAAGAYPVAVPLKKMCTDLDGIRKRITANTRLIFINNPHNPTGSIVLEPEFARFLESMPPEIIVVMDEAYIEFVRHAGCADSLGYVKSEKPIITLRTFSKAYGLAGLRVGYGVTTATIAELLNRIRQPFNVSSLAQTGAVAALDDDEFLAETMQTVHAGLMFFYEALDRMEISYFRTHSNFFLIDVKQPADAVYEALLKEGVIVRSMTSYGFPHFIRVNVGRMDENIRCIEALKKVMQ